MFFILSKTLNYLVMPISMVCIILLLSVLVRNSWWKKRLFWFGLLLLIFFSNDFISNEVMSAWETEVKPFNSLQPHKLGIVLTGATISRENPNDRVYFAKGADRVVHTVQLYKLDLIEKILISGGSGRLTGEAEPEADKFKKAMLLMGIPEADIIIENETRNTYESAVAVKPMLDSLGYKSEECLLITSAFHMRRSIACYRKTGVNLESFSTDFYTHERDFHIDTLLVPKLDAIIIWQKLIKEWVGMAAYKIAGYV